jgi:hypothetical protein
MNNQNNSGNKEIEREHYVALKQSGGGKRSGMCAR